MPTDRLDENSRGVFIISVTPFHEDGRLDLDSLDTVLDFYIGQGVHGITLLGMMGEANKLTDEESAAVVRRGLTRVAGRVPVVVGASNPSLEAMRRLVGIAMEGGAAGIMVAPTPGLRTDDQVHAWTGQVCAAVGADVPLVWQDYPPTTGVYLSASLFGRLVRDYPQVAMLKAEDNPGLGKITAIREAESGGQRRAAIVVGNGGLFLPQALARGADGIMTGFGFPRMLVEVFDRHTAGDADGAEDAYDRYLPLVTYEQQPGFGLAVRKELLHRHGALRSATVRTPGPRLSDADRAELDRLLGRLEARLARTATA
ncbi:MAG: dihydrodipicolinate synthase family protein [Gemmatimonadota bacterium]|jgi:4-hydroxy-tetrahydrodipicolinate synthase